MDYNLFKHFPVDGDLGGFLLSSFDFAPMNSVEVDNNMQMLFFFPLKEPHIGFFLGLVWDITASSGSWVLVRQGLS